MLLLFSIVHFFRSVELFSFITVKSCFCFHAPVSFVINFFSCATPFNRLQRLNWKENRHEILCLPAQISDFGPVMNAEFPKCIPSRLQKVAQMMNLQSRHLSMQVMKWECYQTLYFISAWFKKHQSWTWNFTTYEDGPEKSGNAVNGRRRQTRAMHPLTRSFTNSVHYISH